jgi:hypothetical protein
MRIPGVEEIDRALSRLERPTPGRLARALAFLGTRSKAELEGLVPGLAADLGGDWRGVVLRLAARLARRRARSGGGSPRWYRDNRLSESDFPGLEGLGSLEDILRVIDGHGSRGVNDEDSSITPSN